MYRIPIGIRYILYNNTSRQTISITHNNNKKTTHKLIVEAPEILMADAKENQDEKQKKELFYFSFLKSSGF